MEVTFCSILILTLGASGDCIGQSHLLNATASISREKCSERIPGLSFPFTDLRLVRALTNDIDFAKKQLSRDL